MKSVTVNNLTFNVGNIIKYKYKNKNNNGSDCFFVVLLIQILNDGARWFGETLVLYDEASVFSEKPGSIVGANFINFTTDNTEIIA
jgi:hypothetical protein